MKWWLKNAHSIEALAATITALVAVAALIGVKVQLDTADSIQQAQSARDAYRAHLSLAATHPKFARPIDACHLLASDVGGGYIAFVDHLIYSAEQMLVVDADWEDTFLNELKLHNEYLCSASAPTGQTKETIKLLTNFRRSGCPDVPVC